MNSLLIKLLLFTSITSCFYGCKEVNFSLLDKKEYLRQYKKFIEEVQAEHMQYERKDWIKTDNEHHRYAHKLYEHYLPSMSLREKIEVGKYPVMYYLCRYQGTVQATVRRNYGKDAAAFKQNISEIIDSTYKLYDNYGKTVREVIPQNGRGE